MPTSTVRGSSRERANTELFEDVTCPFCGILCDDLEVKRSGEILEVVKSGCGRSKAGFERKLPPSSPRFGARTCPSARRLPKPPS